MLTKDGVKLLDFGLARWGAEESTDATDAATLTAASMPALGMVSGTLPYMSPEQLEGARGDKRSDLFAFGTVLYEMAAGHRAFLGDSPTQVIAAILHHQPEGLTALRPTIPASFDRVVSKCLSKDPDARWQSASDLADELRWIAREGGAHPAAVLSRLRRGRVSRGAAIAIGGLLLTATAVVVIRQWRNWAGSTLEVRYRKVTSSGDVIMSAISPDGRTVAYLAGTPGGETRIVLREVEGGESSPIWTSRDVLGLTWLTDGAHLIVVGTHDKHGAWIVPVVGGPARRVTTYGTFVASSPDGTAIALSDDGLVGFHIVSLTGGEARFVKLPGVRRVLAIDWHARTNRIVLSTVDEENELFSIWSIGLDGREASRLHTGNVFVRAMCASPASDVVYAMVHSGDALDLLRIPLAPEPGAARVLVTGLTPTTMGYRCSVSRDGRRLLYSHRVSQANLWRLDFSRSPTHALALTPGTRNLWFPSVSPDGQWIVATTGSQFDPELVKLPITGGEPVSLGEGAGAVWSPEGGRLAFTSRRTGSLRVWISGANGQRPQEVKDSPVGDPRPAWLPDGRLAWQTPDRHNYRIRHLLTGHDEFLLAETSSTLVSDAFFSPRGGDAALRRQQSTQLLSLVSFSDRSERWLGSSMRPIGWSADGEWIYALAFESQTLVRVSAQTQARERIGPFPEGRQIGICDLTPDPRLIICSLSNETFDAWIMADFDPTVP